MVISTALDTCIVNSLPIQIALLDPTGKITFVNDAWRQFAADGEATTHVVASVGLNYLDVCRNVQGKDAPVAQQIVTGLEAVLAGKQTNFTLDYPCHTLHKEQWYRVFVTPFCGESGGAVITHCESTQQKRIENDLQQSEARNRALTNLLPGLIVHAHGDGTILDLKVSPGFPALLRPTAAVIGKRPSDFLPGPLAQQMMTHLAQALQSGEVQSFEYETKFSNEGRILEVSVIPVLADEVIALVRDITERRRNEREQQQQEKFIQLVLDTSPSPIFVKDGKGNFLLVNQAIADLYEMSKEQLISSGRAALHNPLDELTYYNSIDRRVLDERVTIAGEDKFTKPNGQIGWYYVVKTPLVQEDGTVRVLGISIDITERKQAEEALQQSEARNRALLDAIPDAILRVTGEGVIIDAKIPTDFMAAHVSGTLIGKNQSNILPPQLALTAVHTRQVALKTGTLQTYEYEVNIADEMHIREARIVPVDQKEVIVILRDVTERKEMEEALRQSEAQNRALLEAIPDTITRMRRDGVILSMKGAPGGNRTFSESIGKNVDRIVPPEFAQQGLHYVQQALQTGSVQTFEYEVPLAGTGCNREARIVPVTDDEVIIITRDITERKRMEEALRQSEAQNRALLEAIPDLIVRVSSDGTNIDIKQPKNFVSVGSAAELVGTKQADVLPAEVYRQFSHYQNLALTTGELQTFEYMLEVDHEIFSREARIVPIGTDEVIAILRDITKNVRQRAQLRAMSKRLAELQEAERKELARELHDQVGQNLTALALNLKIIQSQLPPEVANEQRLQKRFADSASLLEQTTTAIRDVMAELRPPVLDDYGLWAALRWYSLHVATRNGLAVELHGEEVRPRLPETVENAFFRIAQESLTNISKHAQASQATVKLATTPDRVALIICDNGRGFDMAALSKPGINGGWGLLNMKERAMAVGGDCRIVSSPGQGTVITIEVMR